MKRFFIAIAMICAALSASAQTSRYEQRYDLLVSQFGPAGVGVETALNNWEKADSANAKMLLGKFSYYYTKAQSSEVESRPSKRYLGMDPVLTLKDSLGNNVYYYNINVFDDQLYGEAMKVADKAIALWPDKLDFRFMKANAYIAYEKDSPDMALAFLKALADENDRRKSSWTYDNEKVDQAFFREAMQEYCFSFYSIGSPSSYDAFYALSEKLSQLFPSDMQFVNNMGSYYLVAKKDYKTAYKYYNKVLKVEPDNASAIRNGVLAARNEKNAKQEKKYLQSMIRYGSESEKLQAQARLDQLK